MREIFPYVMYLVILSTHGCFYNGLHTWHEIKLNLLHYFSNAHHSCFYHMTSRLRVIYSHILNLIIYWFIYMYLVTLCNDIDNNNAFYQNICTPKLRFQSNFNVI